MAAHKIDRDEKKGGRLQKILRITNDADATRLIAIMGKFSTRRLFTWTAEVTSKVKESSIEHQKHRIVMNENYINDIN